MRDAARTPPGNRSPTLPTVALAFLAGAGACLLLPRLPSWPWLAGLLLVAPGLGWFLRNARSEIRLAAPLLLGFGLAGVHAAVTLSRQLPPSLEQRELTVSGRVIDLPQSDTRGTRFKFLVDDAPVDADALAGKRLQLTWYDERQSHDERPVTPSPSASRRFSVQSGSRWRITVKLRPPRGLRNPGGFDSEKQ